jgi:hypothetical protein
MMPFASSPFLLKLFTFSLSRMRSTGYVTRYCIGGENLSRDFDGYARFQSPEKQK